MAWLKFEPDLADSKAFVHCLPLGMVPAVCRNRLKAEFIAAEDKNKVKKLTMELKIR